MVFGERLTEWSVRRYRLVTVLAVAATLIVAALAALPSLLPGVVPMLSPIRVDTDPENMLRADEPVRQLNDRMKNRFGLHDMVVVGVVNEQDANGVFNPSSLGKIYELTKFALTLNGPRVGRAEGEGVIVADAIAPSVVDRVGHVAGSINFSWLMHEPPATQAEAMKIRDDAMRVPFLEDTLVSRDGKAIAIYLPVTSKDLSHAIYTRLQEKARQLGGPEQYHITGLPVAEDTFGVEMFVQMAISAPAAMGVIFLLMLLFFRKLLLIVAPMIVAMMSVIITMGALIVAGFPIHIMSSMIPIFIMPISVLDSVHIISEFFERYQATRDKRATIIRVMEELFQPMLYTSLTSAAGFASLALTPIPPVQVFGIFIAAGVMIAWVLTVTFIPAFVMFIPDRTLAKFGAVHHEGVAQPANTLGRFLRYMGGFTYRRAKAILAVTILLAGVTAYGITKINVNDNPVKWFAHSHPIRQADTVLNQHFGGTYMTFLALSAPDRPFDSQESADHFARQAGLRAEKLKAGGEDVHPTFQKLSDLASQSAKAARSWPEFFDLLESAVKTRLGSTGQAGASPAPAAEPAESSGPVDPFASPAGNGEPAAPSGFANQAGGQASAPAIAAAISDAERSAWEAARSLIDDMRAAREVFKDPAVLDYVGRLQAYMGASDGKGRRSVVGKSNSLADIVKTVNRDYISGQEKDYRLPANSAGVTQLLSTYQSSHRKDDLWHFVTRDYRSADIWLQLTSGDNQDMSAVVAKAEDFLRDNPPPASLEHDWFGLTYINVQWQEKMVTGMLESFSGSFLVVLLLMILLFRSGLWGLLSMIPLTVTIGAIYGMIGLVGKDYDMPVAVLSSLTLGMAVDFAIHFMARGKLLREQAGTWQSASPSVFGEPARAIARNIIVIAAGFLPLLLAPLVPYRTVGVLLATILLVSGMGTLLILPALMRVLEKFLFPAKGPTKLACNCGTCIISAVALAALFVLNLKTYSSLGWNWLVLTGAGIVILMTAGCQLSARRSKCRTTCETKENKHE